jgi:hypothetical protein
MFDSDEQLSYQESKSWETKPQQETKGEVTEEQFEELHNQGVALLENLTNKVEVKTMAKNKYHLNLNLGEYTNLVIDLEDTSDEASSEIAEKIAYSERIMKFVGLRKVKELSTPKVEAPKPKVDPLAPTPVAPVPQQQPASSGVTCQKCGSFTKYAEGTSKFGIYKNYVCQNPACGARGFINKDKATGADVITWKDKRK